MKVITNETVSKNIISFGYSEIALTALMLAKLKQGDTFVDVGGHYGYEAMLASKLVGNTGAVYSFEPNPASYKMAKGNLKATNIQLHNYAIGNYKGVAKMLNNDILASAFNRIVSDADDSDYIEVPILPLDDILANNNKPVNFIKCDVEGFELEVLEGSLKTMAKDKPLIVLEADMPENGKPSARALQLQNFMAGLNYTAYDFDLQNGALKIDKLGTLNINHANVLFMPDELS